MLDFTYPNVSNIELVSTQPKPADLRSIEYIQTSENTTLAPISYIVKINLSSQLPATSLGFQLYVGNEQVQKYSGFKNGLYFKVNNPRFFSVFAGKEIRFSLDRGEAFHNTGVLLPSLAGDGRRSSSPANLENLPTQEEVLK